MEVAVKFAVAKLVMMILMAFMISMGVATPPYCCPRIPDCCLAAKGVPEGQNPLAAVINNFNG